MRGTGTLLADRVWDGVTATPIEHGFVAVDGGKIAAVGRQADLGSAGHDEDSIALPADTTLMPGLIDCHQHLVFNGNGTLEEQLEGVDDEALAERARSAAARALSGGVTTLRDLGDRSFVTLPLRDDPSLPTIIAAGPPLTRVNGHCWYLGGECNGIDELRRAVRDRIERGCDAVKVMVTGGGLTATFPMWDTQFTDAEMRAIVEEAHQAGLPVAAHCHGVAGIVQALDAGADSIEHCTFMTVSGRCEAVPDVVARLANSSVAVSATVGRLPDFVPPPFVSENLPAVVATRRQLHALGATVVVGTDAGINVGKPHDVLPHALRELIDSGMTPVEGLRAVTSVAAKVCGVADRKGQLAPGFDADLVAIAGDPFTAPQAVTDIAGVWRAGRKV